MPAFLFNEKYLSQIPALQLFTYTQLLLAVNKNEAKYATAGTAKDFWRRR